MVIQIIWLILLIDSILCNLIVWFNPEWYSKKFRIFAKLFPPAKGWAALYLILVIWLGFAMSIGIF